MQFGKPRTFAQLRRSAMLKQIRAAKRIEKQANYHANGLNGPQAVARRARQRGAA